MMDFSLAHPVLTLAHFGPPADKPRGQTDAAERVLEETRAVRLLGWKVPINERRLRAGRDQHRQAPLAEAEFRRRVQARFAAWAVFQWSLDGNARGLHSK